MPQQHLVSEFNLESIIFFLLVVHVGTFIFVHFTKYFFCQWLPLTVTNWTRKTFKSAPLPVLCDRPRKFLTQFWAFGAAYAASLYIWPQGLIPPQWSLTQHQIAAINAVLDPLLIWGLFVVLSSNSKTRGLAEAFGSKALDLEDAKAEVEEAASAGDAAKTVFRNVTGFGKPPTGGPS